MKQAQVPAARVRGSLPPLAPRGDESPDGYVRPLYSLYTPGQVGLATFLGSPLAGGWLISRNFKKLDKPGLGWLMMLIGFVWTVGLCTLGAFEKMPGIVSIVSIPGMTLLMRWVQGRDFDDHTSRGGAHTSWGYVVLAGFSCLAIVIAAVVGIAIAYTLAVTPPSVSAPNGAEVRYTDGATEADAIRVRDALAELGYFTGAITVQVQRDNNRWLVGYVVTDSALRDHKTVVAFGDLSETLSAKAFHGEPVDTVLMNDLGELTKSRTEFEHRLRTLMFGQDEIRFRDVSEPEVNTVARVLKELRWFGLEEGQVAKLDRKIALEVELFMPDAQPPEVDGMHYKRMARAISDALGQTAVELSLGDLDGKISKRYPWSERILAPVIFGTDTPVYYKDDTTRTQAEQVAAILNTSTEWMVAVVITHDDNYQPPRAVIGVYPLSDPDEDVLIAQQQTALRSLAEPLSKRVFANTPVDVRILDNDLNVTQVLSWEDRAKRTGAIRPKR